MAITATTLSAAATISGTTIAVTSATGITAPNYQIDKGVIFLLIENEYLLVTGVSGTIISVLRAQNGSYAAAHANGATVQIGLLSDFPAQQKLLQNEIVNQLTVNSSIEPDINLTGSADAISATASGYYLVKTAGVDAMTLVAPTAAAEGIIISIYSDTTNAHTLTATALLANGTALKTTATFAAFRGAGLKLRATNLVWHVLTSSAITFT